MPFSTERSGHRARATPRHLARASTSAFRRASLELALLGRYDRSNLRLGDPQLPHHGFVEHQRTASRDRSHRELLVPQHAELPNNEHVQWQIQLSRYFIRDRDATARQREHDHVRTARILGQRCRQSSPCIGSVRKARCHDRYLLSAPRLRLAIPAA